MNLKQLVLLIIVLFPYLSNAQTNNVPKCGISPEAGDLIMQRLMDNRNQFTKKEVEDLMNKRTITYIPLSIHNVAADNAGTGRISEHAIFGFLCGLNDLYADQDVQFYIHNQIYNRVSNFIYINASTTSARNDMLGFRVAGTLNLIVGASSQNQVASWYDPSGDFVFLLHAQITSEAKTEAHEIGHFFTLNHTFRGWENIDATIYNGQNVPTTVGSGWNARATEAAPRTGSQKNCETAADGFCDTPADFFSGRLNCPYNPQMFDRYGNTIDPDETNIMCYAFDQCVTNFTTEQKTAIAMDIAVRSWVSGGPASTADVTGTPTVVSPVNTGQLGSINNSTVRLDWSDVTGATWYFLEVYGTNLPGIWLPNTNNVIYKGMVMGNSHFDLPTNNLVAGAHYVWKVKAMNATSTCAPISSFSRFEAVTSITTDIQDLPIEKQMTLTVNSNPITTSYIPLSIYSAEDVIGSIKIYGMDGREALTLAKQSIAQGESLLQLPAEDLANGMYVAVLMTDRGQLQQKLIIQR